MLKPHLWPIAGGVSCELQMRSKCQLLKRDLEEENLVLVNNEYLPPGKWVNAEFTNGHPGADDKASVHTLKTKRVT